MASSVHGSNKDLHVQVVSRRLVMASDASIEPHVLTVSNLDLLPQTMQVSMFCIYPNPPAADFAVVVAAFEAGLPSLLNHFFPFAGRIATCPSSGLPKVRCCNQGAEFVVGAAGVALAALDYADVSASLGRIQLPYGADVALSVQVVSFACGGFTVAWSMNHLLGDGCALSSLVSAWSELAVSRALSRGSRPNHHRAVFRPRAALDEAFTPVRADRQVNVLTWEQNAVGRLYYIEASGVERLREAASRNGRRATRVQAVSAYLWKALAGPSLPDGMLRAAMRNYIGNVTTFVVREERVDEVVRAPLSDVAAMVSEAIAAPAYDEHFQELVDWVEEHKIERYVETAGIGLGSPAMTVSSFASFRTDTDFGFGPAAMAIPLGTSEARLRVGFMHIAARPGGDGSLIATAFLWPWLAAALESDEPRVFGPVTAEYLACLLRKRKFGTVASKLWDAVPLTFNL
ncbi:omega-hydroxypalmitate O-feruloyl transferase-like [Panicum miliaceum]|uniref:Omega-hydroxypalmitate O-feruloyl transferase-like n=1 Tax=Panicum miliaceum TaxID=4540 RepID=A0A3L6SPW0_PANMI|nr:omega-hydroxypalmitate O-feruloyl transferase-like [Panicum miliaceum]